MTLMRTPRSVGLSITNQCNLRCVYCSHFSSAGDVDYDLSTEEWLTFFSELGLCQVMNLVIEGGEPLFRKDLRLLLESIVSNRMRYSILTNGLLIDDNIASFIASTGRCNIVQVSLDGSNPAHHDPLRGTNSFLKAVNGIKILQKHNVPVTVRVTIHKQNVNDLSDIAEFLLDELKIGGISTNVAGRLGLCQSSPDDVMMSVDEYSMAMEELLHLSRKYQGRISAQSGPLADAVNWMKMERASQSQQIAPIMIGHLTGCGGVFKQMDVRADGVIVPCTHLSHIELGRINHDDFGEIWRDHSELNKIRDRRTIPLTNFEYCQDCKYISHCTGSCPGLAYTTANQVDVPAPDSCLKLFLENGGTLPIERIST